jgi:hypothetical protein
MSKRTLEKQVSKTPEQILRQTAAKFRRFDLNSQVKAQLIVDLPDMVQEAVDRGDIFPQAELGRIYGMAASARELLEDNNTFGLRVLLIPWGNKTGDPNELEELIARVYPPQA